MDEPNRFEKCSHCKEYHFTHHKCNDEYLVYYEPYLGDDSKKFRADDHEDAACKFADYYNTRNDYCLMNNEIEVSVEFKGIMKKFKVGAEPSIHYNSREIQ